MSLKLVAIACAVSDWIMISWVEYLWCCSLKFLALGLSQVLAAAVTTARPYKFGFTIDEQQHRAEQRGEIWLSTNDAN